MDRKLMWNKNKESIHITLHIFQHLNLKLLWGINPLKCLSAYLGCVVCVCVCVILKGACGCKQCSACSYSNGRDAPK